MILQGNYRNLGDPICFWGEIIANNLKKRGCGDGKLEVGLTHSRGVVP